MSALSTAMCEKVCTCPTRLNGCTAAGGLSGIGPMLEERAVMKAETSDALYGLAPYIISMFIVNLVSAV